MTTPTTLIVEQGVIAPLGGSPGNLVVVPRRRSPWYRRRSRWAPLDPETVLDTLAAVPRPAVVLARGPVADRGASALLDLATLLGFELRRLPDCAEAAAWSIGVVIRAGESGSTAGGRAIDVMCSAPTRAMRGSGLVEPPLRADALWRWASCAWRPCPWCAAGGIAGDRCARCGSLVERDAREVRR